MRALESRGDELAARSRNWRRLREVGESRRLEPRPRRGPRTRSSPTPCGSPKPTADRSWSTTKPATRSMSVGRSAAAPTYWTAAGRSRSIANPPWSDGPRWRDSRSRFPTWPRRARSAFWTFCSGTAGVRCSRSPCSRGDKIMGVLVIRRREHGQLSRRDITELLETFATQSALAIVNARLFRELRDQDAASSRSPAATSRSSWPACRTNCGPR